ncbi:MAG: hypothetical protein ACK44W_08355, partial [Planctomycetota bacterium]
KGYAMNLLETLTLNADDYAAQRRHRALSESLRDFVPRSSARRLLEFEPEATLGHLLALLSDHQTLWREDKGRCSSCILRGEGEVLFVQLLPGHAEVNLFSSRLGASQILEKVIEHLAPLRRRAEAGQEGVWAGFSRMDNEGTILRRVHYLRCPRWDEIRENYPPGPRRDLEHLLALKDPWSLGRLIIWHGPPGTGKTYALRALMMHWADRFEFLVVTDPERLAAQPEYYFELASEPAERPPRRLLPPIPDDMIEEDDDESDEPRRRFFILEDAADLILQESRAAHFDKIGKLLNMTDGLFGQGREDLFLLTFNEDVHRIDPAFLRPGRLITRVEFTRFSRPEAADWLQRRGARAENLPEESTLAELYGCLRGTPLSQDPGRSLGLPLPP